MRSGRLLASLATVLVALLVVTLGVTWASDDPSPRLERDGDGMLFADVELEPGVPLSRCATIRPRRAPVVGLDLSGSATGSLAPEVRMRITRGVAPVGDLSCSGFVPEETVYDGRLDALPTEDVPISRAMAWAAGTTAAYRATIELVGTAAGRTTFGLRITGSFGTDDRRPERLPLGASAVRPTRCLQRRTSARVGRTVRRGRRALVVRTPATLPVTVVRPLPVYVASTSRRRPTLIAAGRAVALRRVGDRWRGYVPLRRLAGRPGFEVRSGDGLRIHVPVPTRSCAARLRAFVRRGGSVDVRVDTSAPLRGARLRTAPALGTPRALLVTVAGTDARGRAVRRTGRAGSRGLPTVRVAGRTVEVTDVPARTTTLSLRLAFHDRNARRLRQITCRDSSAVDGAIATDLVRRQRTTLRLEGDRCGGAY